MSSTRSRLSQIFQKFNSRTATQVAPMPSLAMSPQSRQFATSSLTKNGFNDNSIRALMAGGATATALMVAGYTLGREQGKKDGVDDLLKDSASARKFLPEVLQKSDIKGDMAFPVKGNASGVVRVTPWQRGAAGATVVVFARDEKGELHVALGQKNKMLEQPQGYMEIPLPKGNGDLTGLSAKAPAV